MLSALRKGMLCFANQQFFGFELSAAARATGADLLWRVKIDARLPREQLRRPSLLLAHAAPRAIMATSATR